MTFSQKDKTQVYFVTFFKYLIIHIDSLFGIILKSFFFVYRLFHIGNCQLILLIQIQIDHDDFNLEYLWVILYVFMCSFSYVIIKVYGAKNLYRMSRIIWDSYFLDVVWEFIIRSFMLSVIEKLIEASRQFFLVFFFLNLLS